MSLTQIPSQPSIPPQPIDVSLSVLQAEDRAHALLRPPPDIKVSEWAERNRILPKGKSARPGLWVTESYQREIMDACLNPDVREIIFKKSTQVGWTEALNNIIGYYIDVDPKPILVVQPTDDTAKKYSKTRLAPMIANCAALRIKVREATSRQSGNTILLKDFEGGSLRVTGSKSGAGLRSDPIAILICDEIETYPDDVDGEGDPIQIAQRRTDTFPDAKIFKGGTPKIEGLSRVEDEWERSDQRLWKVPCPHCGVAQALYWQHPDTKVFRLVWDRDEFGDPIPSTVRYLCESCGEGITERNKQDMLDAGFWEPTFPGRSVVGFYLNALYSPWRPIWAELAKEWTDAQGNPEKLKAFINLRLGQPWREQQEHLKLKALIDRVEDYERDTVPAGVGVLVAAADVQHDRIEAHILGFGAEEESWVVSYERFEGDPGAGVNPKTGRDPWTEFWDFLIKPRYHASGLAMYPSITLVDSGDNSDSVYDFVIPRQHTRQRVYASKGASTITRIGLAQEGFTKRAKVRQWTIATYACKDRILARMKIANHGPGYMHFPSWITDEYLNQLLAERKITMRDKRTRIAKSVYVQGRPNEALDLTVYAHAGLFILQTFVAPNIYRDLSKVVEMVKSGKDPEAAPVIERRIRRFDM